MRSMVEGQRASRRRVEFSNGAVAFAYSAERPEKLRGPQHHFAWCDELGKWPPSTGSGQATVGRGEKAWDNLQMTMRLGTRPRIVVTTTPRPTALVRRVVAAAGEEGVTRGRMEENWTLPEAEVAAVTALYAGTRLGRQEIGGELLEDVAGEAGGLVSRAGGRACRADGRRRIRADGARVAVAGPGGCDGACDGGADAGAAGGGPAGAPGVSAG
ncbi:MAG TPA: terminase family protein [Allosphingosinicella sp.]|nr:terminase family protein [Allosphingosinicella sp.]